MKKTALNNVSMMSGDIEKELLEIKKTQKVVDSYLTLLTNTCSGFLTLVCC